MLPLRHASHWSAATVRQGGQRFEARAALGEQGGYKVNGVRLLFHRSTEGHIKLRELMEMAKAWAKQMEAQTLFRGFQVVKDDDPDPRHGDARRLTEGGLRNFLDDDGAILCGFCLKPLDDEEQVNAIGGKVVCADCDDRYAEACRRCNAEGKPLWLEWPGSKGWILPDG